MIELKYSLSRDEGDSVVEFNNPLDRPVNNLTIIKGNNSLGKSSILNIIAYGLYGIDNDKILPNLKNKMKILEDQDLTFDFQISRDDIGIRIESKKLNPRKQTIEVIEHKGTSHDTISKEIFENDYNLIYDIPDQTMDRLRKSIDEIISVQRSFGERAASFREYLRKTIEEIDKTSNPGKIVEYSNQIGEARKMQQTITQLLEQERASINTLWTYTGCKYLYDYDSKLRSCTDTKQQMIVRRDQIRKGLGKIPKARNKNERMLAGQKSDLITAKSRAVDDLVDVFGKKKAKLIEGVSAINITDAFEKGKFSSATMEAIYAAKEAILKAEKEENERTQDLEEARVYSDLIHILERHGGSSIRLPGIDKTISEFIQMLKDANSKNDSLLEHLNHIKQAKESLSLLDRGIIDANEALEKASSTEPVDVNSDRQELINLNKDIDEIDEKIKVYEKKRGFYYAKVLEKKIDPDACYRVFKEMENTEKIEDFKLLSEQTLLGKIQQLEEGWTEKNSRISGLDKQISIWDSKKKELEEAKPHIYQDRLADIKRIWTINKSVDDTLRGEFKEYLEAISSSKKMTIGSETGKRYHAAISQYLGNRIGSIKYQDAVYETESIDLINGKIAFKGGKKIRLDYISTGQSQSAYLLNLLNTEDPRKMIVLLDEVGMITTDTLKPVYEKIESLYHDGKLMACIVAQVSDEKKLVAVDLKPGK